MFPAIRKKTTSLCREERYPLLAFPPPGPFMEAFLEKTRKLVVGDPRELTTDVGAVISHEHREKVMQYIHSAPQDGGEIVLGGGIPDNLPADVQHGFFVNPTIIEGLTDTSRLVREEIFGPVVTVQPFTSEDEVIARANATRYGLSATVWTGNLGRAHRVAAALDAGVIWVNTWFLRDLRTPFGGMKESGVGREGGVHSFEFYSELKNVCVKI